MNNSKLINVLRTFSRTEMKEFEKFVTSTYFNKGRNYLPYLAQLRKFYPRFEDEKMTPEYIHSKLYPGKKYNKQIIWNMNSALFNIAEEYLIHLYLKKNDFDRNCHSADELSDRNLTKLYTQKLEIMGKDLDNMDLSEIYFYSAIQLELRRISIGFYEDKQHLSPGLVARKGEYAILYFLVLLSNVINNMNYSSLLFNARYEMNIPYEFVYNLQLDRIIDYAKSRNFKYTYVMEIYYCLIMTSLRPEDTTYFLRAKEIFELNSKSFDTRERDNMLGVLINYCAYKVNKGEENFRKMLFEVNKLQLKEIDELRKKEIGKTFYIQVFRNTLSINEIDWAKQFIDKYTPYLKQGLQKSMRALAEAILFSKLKEYDKVIDKLNNVRFSDTRDKFYVKSLTLRAYYELGEIPTLVYYIDSAMQFAGKNPSLGILTRENFNSFLVSLKKFLAYNEKNDIYGIEKLRKDIEMNRSMINRDWLLEKIDEQLKKTN